jgi:hypothetical protein
MRKPAQPLRPWVYCIVLFKTFRRKVAYLLVAYLVISNCKQIQKYSAEILQKNIGLLHNPISFDYTIRFVEL